MLLAKLQVFADQPELGGVHVVDGAEVVTDPSAVRYVTVYRFKGLEADCALLTGFPADDSRHTAATYVAASRARLLLYVFYRDDVAEQRRAG